MALKCNVQEWSELRSAHIDRLLHHQGTSTEVEFTINDRDQSSIRGYFFAPKGFRLEALDPETAENWQVTFGVRQNGFGVAAVYIVGLQLGEQVVPEDRIHSL